LERVCPDYDCTKSPWYKVRTAHILVAGAVAGARMAQREAERAGSASASAYEMMHDELRKAAEILSECYDPTPKLSGTLVVREGESLCLPSREYIHSVMMARSAEIQRQVVGKPLYPGDPWPRRLAQRAARRCEDADCDAAADYYSDSPDDRLCWSYCEAHVPLPVRRVAQNTQGATGGEG
jgi:hypothetical protein